MPYICAVSFRLLMSTCKHIRIFLTVIISLIFSFVFSVHAQEPAVEGGKAFNNWSGGIRYYAGSYITSQPKSEYIRDSYASFGELYVEKRTNGKENWHISHKYPSVGLGFLFGNPGSKKYIGNLYALYPYIKFPVITSGRYEASLKMGGGAAFIEKPYDIYTNPKNTLIGTRANVFLNFIFQHQIRLSDKLSLDAGLGIMHISNGSTTLPNLGLNIPNLSAGIRYSPGKPLRLPRKATDTSSSKIDYAAYTSVSVKQYPWVGGSYYLINAMQLEGSKRIKRNYSVGAGLLLLYNRTLRRYIMEDRPENPTYKKFQAGIYLSYEHFLGKLSIPVNIGGYFYNGSSSGIFQQYGVRYRINKHISSQILLKSHGGQADFIHVGAGYNF